MDDRDDGLGEFGTRASGEYFGMAATARRYVESSRGADDGASVLYLTGGDLEGSTAELSPDAVVLGDDDSDTVAAASAYGDVPVYGPPATDAPGVTPLAPRERVDVGDIELGAAAPDEETLGLAYRVGGVTGVFTPAAELDEDAETALSEQAASMLVEDRTRFHDQFPLHGAVDVLDVPNVEGESELVNDAFRAEMYLVGDRGLGLEVGRQIADTGVAAEATRAASLLEPDGNGVTYTRHDDPDAVGSVQAADTAGFDVETDGVLAEQDGPTPSVRDVSRTLIARGPRSESLVGGLERRTGPDDEMEPDGEYAAEGVDPGDP